MSLGVMGGKRGGARVEGDDDDDDDGVDDGIWDVNPNPAALRDERQRGGEGYAVPEEQFGYEDTTYAGAGGQVGRRSVEERM